MSGNIKIIDLKQLIECNSNAEFLRIINKLVKQYSDCSNIMKIFRSSPLASKTIFKLRSFLTIEQYDDCSLLLNSLFHLSNGILPNEIMTVFEYYDNCNNYCIQSLIILKDICDLIFLSAKSYELWFGNVNTNFAETTYNILYKLNKLLTNSNSEQAYYIILCMRSLINLFNVYIWETTIKNFECANELKELLKLISSFIYSPIDFLMLLSCTETFYLLHKREKLYMKSSKNKVSKSLLFLNQIFMKYKLNYISSLINTILISDHTAFNENLAINIHSNIEIENKHSLYFGLNGICTIESDNNKENNIIINGYFYINKYSIVFLGDYKTNIKKNNNGDFEFSNIAIEFPYSLSRIAQLKKFELFLTIDNSFVLSTWNLPIVVDECIVVKCKFEQDDSKHNNKFYSNFEQIMKRFEIDNNYIIPNILSTIHKTPNKSNNFVRESTTQNNELLTEHRKHKNIKATSSTSHIKNKCVKFNSNQCIDDDEISLSTFPADLTPKIIENGMSNCSVSSAKSIRDLCLTPKKKLKQKLYNSAKASFEYMNNEYKKQHKIENNLKVPSIQYLCPFNRRSYDGIDEEPYNSTPKKILKNDINKTDSSWKTAKFGYSSKQSQTNQKNISVTSKSADQQNLHTNSANLGLPNDKKYKNKLLTKEYSSCYEIDSESTRRISTISDFDNCNSTCMHSTDPSYSPNFWVERIQQDTLTGHSKIRRISYECESLNYLFDKSYENVCHAVKTKLDQLYAYLESRLIKKNNKSQLSNDHIK